MPLYLCWWGINIGAQAMNLVCYCLAPIGFGSRSLCMALLKCRLRFGTTKNTMLIGWGLKEDKMDFNVTLLLIVIMLLVWQLVMWKKIKLKKWQDYTLSAIMIALGGWLVYLTFLS